MKTQLTKTTWKYAFERAKQLISMAAFGAAILICSSASAQSLFVSGRDDHGGEVFKFTWDGRQSIFASGLYRPSDLAFDSAGNLFVVDYLIVDGELRGNAAIFKANPNGALTIFAYGVSYASSLAVDKMGNVFVADYDNGIIYEYKPTGSRGTFATGLQHPAGLAFNNVGDLYVADTNPSPGTGTSQGYIYEYKPNGSRATFAVLDPSDRPADLAFDSMGNLFMADLGGNIYKYDSGVLRPHPRTTFGSVPASAQSLAFDGAGNLLVVDAGGVSGSGSVMPNAIYKFTSLGTRNAFASGLALSETFARVACPPLVRQ
jgi:sugar lactone lactonase YvrE